MAATKRSPVTVEILKIKQKWSPNQKRQLKHYTEMRGESTEVAANEQNTEIRCLLKKIV